MTKKRRWITAAGVSLALLVGVLTGGQWVRPAYAVDIGDILKIGGVLLLVSQFGGQIDDFINNVMSQHDAAVAGATKVVPIFSMGRGAYIGAAQIVGVPDQVKLTQGVAALDGTAGNFTGTLLLPMTTKKAASESAVNRVGGVGVSAIIDLHIL
ncbi:MAG TPA: hypothetical protein VGM23_11315 [Armatimonadota bacterium]|jgi:hypothetical protein